jgi:hypothetical protein
MLSKHALPVLCSFHLFLRIALNFAYPRCRLACLLFFFPCVRTLRPRFTRLPIDAHGSVSMRPSPFILCFPFWFQWPLSLDTQWSLTYPTSTLLIIGSGDAVSYLLTCLCGTLQTPHPNVSRPLATCVISDDLPRAVLCTSSSLIRRVWWSLVCEKGVRRGTGRQHRFGRTGGISAKRYHHHDVHRLPGSSLLHLSVLHAL